MKVAADREICISAGTCVMTAEAFFDQDDDGIVQLAAAVVPAAEEPWVRNAVKLCPSGALHVVPE